MTDIRVAAEQARVAALMELADEYVIAATGDTATARHKFSLERKTLQSALEAALQSQPSPVEAQAVPDLPVARLRACIFRLASAARLESAYAGGPLASKYREERIAAEADLESVLSVFTRPTPAAADLHQQIMNLPRKSPYPQGSITDAGYRIGHRDARHAAAELIAAQLRGNNT